MTLLMRYLIVGLLSLIIVTPALLAADSSNEQERLASSAEAVEEILNMPDALPKELLNKAECVVIMPSVKKFALGVGGRGTVARAGEFFPRNCWVDLICSSHARHSSWTAWSQAATKSTGDVAGTARQATFTRKTTA